MDNEIKEIDKKLRDELRQVMLEALAVVEQYHSLAGRLTARGYGMQLEDQVLFPDLSITIGGCMDLCDADEVNELIDSIVRKKPRLKVVRKRVASVEAFG